MFFRYQQKFHDRNQLDLKRKHNLITKSREELKRFHKKMEEQEIKRSEAYLNHISSNQNAKQIRKYYIPKCRELSSNESSNVIQPPKPAISLSKQLLLNKRRQRIEQMYTDQLNSMGLRVPSPKIFYYENYVINVSVSANPCIITYCISTETYHKTSHIDMIKTFISMWRQNKKVNNIRKMLNMLSF